MKKFDLHKELTAMARAWPRPGGELVFFIEPDHVWLHKIRLPESYRGQGSAKMAEFLALTDRAGLPVCLTADPMPDDEWSTRNPQTFELVRWYMRFGFVPHGPSEDGFLMERSPCPGSSQSSIIQQYLKSKKSDMSLDQFNARWNPQSFTYRSFA